MIFSCVMAPKFYTAGASAAFASSAHFIRPDDFEEVYLATYSADGFVSVGGPAEALPPSALFVTVDDDEERFTAKEVSSLYADSVVRRTLCAFLQPLFSSKPPDTSPEFLEAGSGFLPPELLLAGGVPTAACPSP